MSWLYRYEAKSIQRWILATDRLNELRGGSTLIEDLEALAKDALGGRLLYAGAGAATARFDDKEDLERFARWWPMRVARHAPGLELVQAWSRDGLPQLRERLGEARNRLAPDLPEAGPWVARAGRSGLPAVGRDEEGGLLDRGTRARERAGDRDPLGEWMLRGCERLADPPPGGVRLRRDLQRYPEDEGVAVVHADGNALGKAIHGMGIEALKGFSKALTAASRAAAERALAGLVRFEADQEGAQTDPSGRLIVNGRPIVAGGDDFTFLVRGRAGIALAEAWLRAFEEETRAIDSGLTACAGVVLVRKGFPFHQAHRLAEDACKAAKRQYARDSSARSRLRFERVTTAIHELADTGTSWSLSELRALEAVVDATIRIGARGKLRAWAAERDEHRAAEQWARIVEVADPGDRARFDAAIAPFGANGRLATRAALQWSRIHPGRGQSRLWSQP